MKKLTLITVIAIVASFAAAISQPVNGKCGQGKHGRMGNIPGYHFYNNNKADLNLNESQLKKLNEIHDSFQRERIDLQAKTKYAGLEMKNEMNKTDINNGAAFKKQEGKQNARNTMQKMALAYKLDLYNVLTTEQKAKIAELKTNFMKNGMGANYHSRRRCYGSD